MNIKCKEIRCKYNKNFFCNAKEIEVSEKTICQSYDMLKEVKKTKYENHIFENKAQSNLTPNQYSVNVKCEANCLFNKDGNCHANGITVYQNKNCPLCQTFLLK